MQEDRFLVILLRSSADASKNWMD